MVKNPPANAGFTCSIPSSGRSPEGGNILAGIIPWTEEPGGIQSMGSQRVGHNLAIEYARSMTFTLRVLERSGKG